MSALLPYGIGIGKQAVHVSASGTAQGNYVFVSQDPSRSVCKMRAWLHVEGGICQSMYKLALA